MPQNVVTRPAPAIEALERRTLLSTVLVTTEADTGPGSFRAAIEQASADATVDLIRFAPSVDTIGLTSPVVFEGAQDLTIDGRSASVEAAAGAGGTFDLFTATGGGDLTLTCIAFRGGSDGVVVRTPADATGTVRVTLHEAAITDNAEFGLHIDDLTNGSPASIELRLNGARVLANGTAALDKDGIRVDEGGDGDIIATIRESHLNANGAEGVELDESGDGNVRLSTFASTFNDNGFFSSEDFDDGIDVDEAGAGSVVVSLAATQVNGNFDEGVDLNESGDGDLRLSILGLEASGNTDQGVALEELDGGSLIADVAGASVTDNGDDGFLAEEGGAGNLRIRISASQLTGNDGFGVNVVQEPSGNGLLILSGVDLRGNTDGPYDAEETTVQTFAVLT